MSLETVNNAIGDFGPKLNVCRAVIGECLNQHKTVLPAFRISIEEGELALRKSQKEKAARHSFWITSLSFFSERLRENR